MTFVESLDRLKQTTKRYRATTTRFQEDFDQVHLVLMGIRHSLYYCLEHENDMVISWDPREDNKTYGLTFQYYSDDSYASTTFDECPSDIKLIFHKYINKFLEEINDELNESIKELETY